MKKNIIKMTIALFFVLLVVANFALAISGIKVPTIKQVQGGKAESLVGQILGILQFVAVAIALVLNILQLHQKEKLILKVQLLLT